MLYSALITPIKSMTTSVVIMASTSIYLILIHKLNMLIMLSLFLKPSVTSTMSSVAMVSSTFIKFSLKSLTIRFPFTSVVITTMLILLFRQRSYSFLDLLAKIVLLLTKWFMYILILVIRALIMLHFISSIVTLHKITSLTSASTSNLPSSLLKMVRILVHLFRMF